MIADHLDATGGAFAVAVVRDEHRTSVRVRRALDSHHAAESHVQGETWIESSHGGRT